MGFFLAHWQDVVLITGSTISLMLMLKLLLDNRTKIPLFTSLTTVGLLPAYVITFLSLGLYVTSMMTIVHMIVWSLIAWKRHP